MIEVTDNSHPGLSFVDNVYDRQEASSEEILASHAEATIYAGRLCVASSRQFSDEIWHISSPLQYKTAAGQGLLVDYLHIFPNKSVNGGPSNRIILRVIQESTLAPAKIASLQPWSFYIGDPLDYAHVERVHNNSKHLAEFMKGLRFASENSVR
jgi:hypothetical protein